MSDDACDDGSGRHMFRIAYVFPQGDLGGAELATIRWLRAHDRERFDPVAIVLQHGPLLEHLRDLEVTVEVAKFPPKFGDRTGRRSVRLWMAKVLRDHDIALQHSILAWTHSLAGPAADAAGIPEVWFQHTPPRLTGRLDWHAALSSTAHIFANSRYTAKCQERLNLRRFPLTVVPPPVEPSTAQDDRTGIRDDLGFEHDVILATLPGRLQRTKGQDIAVRAFAGALPKAPKLRLAIVGDEAFGLDEGYGAELQTLARDLGVEGEVKFTGHRPDIHDLLKASDIVLSPSQKPEGYGLVVAEALVAGRPVVATNLGATPELVRDGQNGILIPPNDVDRLADVLVDMALNSDMREQLAAAALATEVADSRTGVKLLEEAYLKVLEA